MEEIYCSLADFCLYEREMGWAFTYLEDVIEGFEKLDAEHPYDNGFTFEDVWGGEVLYNDENSVTRLLINNSWGVKSIVKVEEIKE